MVSSSIQNTLYLKETPVVQIRCVFTINFGGFFSLHFGSTGPKVQELGISANSGDFFDIWGMVDADSE